MCMRVTLRFHIRDFILRNIYQSFNLISMNIINNQTSNIFLHLVLSLIYIVHRAEFLFYLCDFLGVIQPNEAGRHFVK